jgi:hypothetical protein
MFVVAGVRKPLQHAHWKRLEEWVREKRRVDKRVFFVEVPAMDIQAEWEEEIRGEESIWDRAFRYTTGRLENEQRPHAITSGKWRRYGGMAIPQKCSLISRKHIGFEIVGEVSRYSQY